MLSARKAMDVVSVYLDVGSYRSAGDASKRELDLARPKTLSPNNCRSVIQVAAVSETSSPTIAHATRNERKLGP